MPSPDDYDPFLTQPTVRDLQQSRSGRQSLGHMVGAVSGARGLLVALVFWATLDALQERPGSRHYETAVSFFQSRWYRDIMAYLGLPPRWLPDGIEINFAGCDAGLYEVQNEFNT